MQTMTQLSKAVDQREWRRMDEHLVSLVDSTSFEADQYRTLRYALERTHAAKKVIGVTSAWYLAESGHEVTLLDRRAAPGMETSFANGGQISAGHAEPWAKPAVVPKILAWLGREDAPHLCDRLVYAGRHRIGSRLLQQVVERNLVLGIAARPCLERACAHGATHVSERPQALLDVGVDLLRPLRDCAGRGSCFDVLERPL